MRIERQLGILSSMLEFLPFLLPLASLLDTSIDEYSGKANKGGNDRCQARGVLVERNQSNAADGSDQTESESHGLASVLPSNVAIDNSALQGLTVLHLAFCHRNNSVGTVGDNLVVPF
ncbi:MAG: hypothetical protein ABMA15_14560 [Vicinamibacterales bacterium]